MESRELVLEKTLRTLSTSTFDEEDKLAQEIVEEAATILGIGIANVINFLNPERVVLGGDVIDEIELYFLWYTVPLCR